MKDRDPVLPQRMKRLMDMPIGGPVATAAAPFIGANWTYNPNVTSNAYSGSTLSNFTNTAEVKR